MSIVLLVKAAYGYEIEPGDEVRPGTKLQVRVIGLPSFEQRWFWGEHFVNKEGVLFLPIVGSLSVSGKSMVELESEIEDKLKKGGRYRSPVVFVHLYSTLRRELGGGGISVGGRVQMKGELTYRRGYTLTSALTDAGVVAHSWGPLEIWVTREEVCYSLFPEAKPKHCEERIYPGDEIVVLRRPAWDWMEAYWLEASSLKTVSNSYSNWKRE